MGYTPGLPPGVYAPHTLPIERLSHIFESSGITGEYLESPISIVYSTKTVIVSNGPIDISPMNIAQYVIDTMASRKLLSNPENKPIIHTFPNNPTFTLTFPEESDAKAAISLSFEISFRGSPLDIRAFKKESDFQLPPMNMQSFHPRRVIVMNVDPEYISRFPDFLYDHFDIDGYFQVPTIPDCVLFDVSQPLAPEAAALVIDGMQFGRFRIHAMAYRSVISRPTEINGEFNVLAEGVDLHQIVQSRNKITVATDELISHGKILKILNIFPIAAINNEEESQIIIYDIALECKKYGDVLKCTVSANPEDGACGNYGVAIVEFNDEESAKNAQAHISGRRYLGRIVVTILCEN